MAITSPDKPLPQLIEDRLPDLIALRHDLHRHPQLAYEETYAGGRVQQWLTQEGITFKAGLAETGVVAWIMPENEQARHRPAVGLRADMDALPIPEETGLPYASIYDGCMHACGHDGHTTILLGAAAVLNELRAQLHQPVKLLFQPAEEGAGGAKRLMDEGALDAAVGGVAAERIFGLHGWPNLPVGHIGVRAGALTASMDEFFITVTGRGAHGAMPELGADPIMAAATITTAIQTIVSRNIAATDAAVISVCRFHAGQATNIIPPRADLSGTIRALDADVRDTLHQRLRQIVEQIAAAMGCSDTVDIRRGYPALINDADCARTVLHLGRRTLTEPATHELDRPYMVAEDFAFYTQKIPGAYFLLGLGHPGQPSYPGLHTSAFDFNDRALATGIRMMCELGLRGNEPDGVAA